MYRLPDSLRAELARPLGPVLADAEGVAAAARARVVVAVGDVTSERLLAGGVVPRVLVVDGKTKRTTDTSHVEARLEPFPRVRVENPPGLVTRALWDALAAALARSETTVVDVDGEEDLAALPAIVLAPDGAAVCYGQPDRGMVVVTVDDKTRAVVNQYLSQMER